MASEIGRGRREASEVGRGRREASEIGQRVGESPPGAKCQHPPLQLRNARLSYRISSFFQPKNDTTPSPLRPVLRRNSSRGNSPSLRCELSETANPKFWHFNYEMMNWFRL
ncbi:hypothetical protein KY285_018248 [Solanum tuberosum]|nr:hypothetical protein KY289_018403 [Solanum tuberosum]KAH0703970.1 hypothetical protein KY285_018248 [Solanum tuberosum]